MTNQWNDEDLVYIDPDTKTVMGRVEWSQTGNPKPLERPDRATALEVTEDDAPKESNNPKDRKRLGVRRKRYYPWGTYRTMKRIFRLEGKEKEVENHKTLDDAIALSMEEPYWD